MSYSTEIHESNPKIIKLKNLLPKFELDEKETYLITSSQLKTKALMYPNGAIYKGMINDKYQREGFGKYFLQDGSIYEGFFKDNKMGFDSITLGSRIMRVETVPLFLLSIINYEFME